jgi:hypothetical protein
MVEPCETVAAAASRGSAHGPLPRVFYSICFSEFRCRDGWREGNGPREDAGSAVDIGVTLGLHWDLAPHIFLRTASAAADATGSTFFPCGDFLDLRRRNLCAGGHLALHLRPVVNPPICAASWIRGCSSGCCRGVECSPMRRL